ncbi:MAG: ATP-grasp domain-containing protein [Raoultibacter sp.]
MIIVDEPYVPKDMKEYLQASKHPVLNNDMARSIAYDYHIVMVDDAVGAACIDAGERLYTTAENALPWVSEHVKNPAMLRAINIFKDKALMRELLAPMYPNLLCRSLSINEVLAVDYPAEAVPFVLKPSVGFCSVGVYAITDELGWDAACADIRKNAGMWQEWYPESVVANSTFVLESYIEGIEYAIDAYYDGQGRARVLNVLRHDFASVSDMSDRLYYSGAQIIRENERLFTDWLDRVNEFVEVKDFPVHVEVRVKEGQVVPIEFNPLRFAGLGGTEISFYGYGFHTYDYYLRDVVPDWDNLLANKDDKLFCMSVLGAPAGMTGTETFDYEAFLTHFEHVFCLNRFDYHDLNAFGFFFFETSAYDSSERDFLLNVDLREFLH